MKKIVITIIMAFLVIGIPNATKAATPYFYQRGNRSIDGIWRAVTAQGKAWLDSEPETSGNWGGERTAQVYRIGSSCFGHRSAGISGTRRITRVIDIDQNTKNGAHDLLYLAYAVTYATQKRETGNNGYTIGGQPGKLAITNWISKHGRSYGITVQPGALERCKLGRLYNCLWKINGRR